MTAKQLNNTVGAFMWVVFIGLVALVFYVLSQFMVYKSYYEPIPGYPEEDSIFTDEYGEKHPAKVALCYHHEAFARPKPMYYDRHNDAAYAIKDSYYAEIASGLPASEKPYLWQHYFWLWFILAFGGLAQLMIKVAEIFSRDVVYAHIKRKPKYEDCCYYLKDSDHYNKHREEVSKLMVYTHADYLCSLKLSFPQAYADNEQFKAEVAIAVEKIINYTARTGSNKIPVDVYFKNCLMDYKKFKTMEIAKLDAGEYCKGETPERKEILRKEWNKQLLESYYPLESLYINTMDHVKPVCMIYDRFFETLLGENVFDCTGVIRKDFDNQRDLDDMRASGNGFKLTTICEFINAGGYHSFKNGYTNYPNVIARLQVRISILREDNTTSTWTFTRYTNNQKFTYSKDSDKSEDPEDLYRSMINNGLYDVKL